MKKIIIAGAFYPNYYIREPIDSEGVDRELSSKDPLKTIVVSQRETLSSHSIENKFQLRFAMFQSMKTFFIEIKLKNNSKV